MRSRHVVAVLAAALGAVLLLLAGVLPPAAPALAAAPASAAAGSGGSLTVPGPPVWQPTTGTYGPPGSVTVSQATDLTDQVIHVSWSGFTPTPGNPPPTFVTATDANALYAVRVYECRGSNPSVVDCYGSTLYGGDPKKGFQQSLPAGVVNDPEFPSNKAVAVTRPDGTGSADIEVWTSHESQTLGCDNTHACSLVVEPNYGGDALGYGQALGTAGGCGDHTYDTADNPTGLPGEATQANFSQQDVFTGFNDGEQCAWSHRVVIPLAFAPTAADCAARAADFSLQGLEMANRLLQEWRSGLCQGSAPLSVQYTPGGGEPQARRAFLSGTGPDGALTAYPDTAPAPRPYVYAPLATSGIAVAFYTDDAVTGAPITSMKLNARLLAKQLTQSYVGQQNADAYASTKGNPACIYQDPEFLALNPTGPNGPHWPSCGSLNGGAALPIVVGGTTDLVQQLTSWIAADPDAAAFLSGKPDPWGMRVDTYYEQPTFSGYPVEAFIPQDASGTSPDGSVTHMKGYEWNPLLGGLVQVARNMLQAQPTDLDWLPDPTGQHDKAGPEPAGSRAVMAILDEGQAAAYSMPQAQLLNPAGAYVALSQASMSAAVADMAVNATTGTQQLPYSNAGSTGFAKDASAYPLTTVQYAMVPTHGLSTTKASKLSDFLQHVIAPAAQTTGFQPGQLAYGFIPLTSGQLTQTAAAACHVLHQDSAKPGNQGGGSAACGGASPSGGGGGSGGGSGAGGLSGGAGLAGGASGGTVSGTSGGTTQGASGGSGVKPATAKGSHPQALGSVPIASGSADGVGSQRLLLPILLITGAVLLVGGPTTLVLTTTDAGERLNRSTRRLLRRLRATRLGGGRG
ncbi:hypothetical protein [Streptacidiphilus fuscans]|uniref:PBP domain-containing protein n=1 Tax=Streptacidiphilus fuscans TaxID=2789292 RepID=A0A931B485_9ACTN|nr:hypothetical protein [Streptacidiphilus fuscans]MBF9070018.1 hypothetical protein [Streptacidiphilus fuscans]